MVEPVAGAYDRTASALHWIVAFLALTMLGLGLFMVEVPRRTPLRGELFDLHKSLGLLLLGFMIARTLWRLTHRAPPLEGLSVFNTRLAAIVHALLYGLLLAQPLAGYIASSLGTFGVAFFGIPLPAWTAPDPGLRAIFLDAHRIIARLLIALILLHLAGTLLHWARGRRDIFWRIWPWRKDET